jgi:uncharacterized protein
MARVVTHVDDLGVDDPFLVEGLPGVGLVGKIAVDHLVSEWEMDHVASCLCEGIPDVAVYAEGDYAVKPPVRIYADGDRDLLALQSDVPVSPEAAAGFADCVTEWFRTNDVTPIFLTGLAAEKEDVPALYGIATGDGGAMLADADVDPPSEAGMISGPTGGLVAEANERNVDGVGLVVEANPQFPDPEAARVLLADAIAPIAGVEVDTGALVEQAEEIAQARERLAQRMQEGSQESSQAQPVGMYQ